MSDRLIIENRTDRPLEQVLPYVKRVVAVGKISGSGDKRQYCYWTTFNAETLIVSATKNAQSDRLVITEGKPK